LNDNESVYKDKETGDFLDMCNGCRRASFIGYALDEDSDKKYVESLLKSFTNQ